MPATPDGLRTLAGNWAALACTMLAGWALACLQSGHTLIAQVLAAIAAAIPLLALLLRLPAYVTRSASTPSTD